jgi:hypothetical protein
MTEVDETTRARIMAEERARLDVWAELEEERRQLRRDRWHNAAPYVIPTVLLIVFLLWGFSQYGLPF